MTTSPWAGASVPPVPAAPRGAPLAFAAEPRRFTWLVVRGAALTLVTLGFYRFWLATDVRRHLWERTRVGDEAPRYTGTSRELLTGFLVAVAVLVPFQVLGFGASLGLGRGPAAGASFLFFALFGRFALYRARRYRLTRTVFRGVRFGAEGSGWAYAGLALAWTGLSIATLGLAYPWQAAALERYKLRRTHYGTLRGAFAGSGWRLALRLAPLWAGAAVGCVTVFLIGFASDARTTRAPGLGLGVGSLVILGLLVLLYPMFRAVTTRWWLDGVRLGGTSLRCELGALAFVGPYVLYLLALVLLVAVGAAAIGGGAYALGASTGPGTLARPGASGQLALFAGALAGYAALALGALALKRRMIDYVIWGRTVASLTLLDAVALERAQALPERANALGEGLADALGAGGL